MIYDKIKSLDRIPFHTPGHKRNTDLLGNDLPYELDITEIEGFDNLHSPKGILYELNNKLNKLYNAKNSYALVNGSTVGILAAVNAVVSEGDTVLMARNCHKSVYNAVEIAKAKAKYIVPEYDEYGIAKGISSKNVEEKLNNKVKLIIITSPTYEGVKSDVQAICELAHKHGIPVLVDAAHGAHLFNEYHNADIVIRGLHKTLPALTQCSAANIYGDLVNPVDFEIKLSMFETSSPSYVLLSSIEKCVDYITQNQFEGYYKDLKTFYELKLNHLKILEYDDNCKIVVFTGYTNISGYQLADKLRENNIEIEMASQDYLIALSSICDKHENLNALKQALISIDKKLTDNKYNRSLLTELPTKYCEAYEVGKSIEAFELKECAEKISAEYIWAYPPGIPIITPGEIINDKVINYIYSHNQTEFYSTYGCLPKKIYCKKFKY